MTDQIRTVALAVCRDAAGRILVERGYDRVRDEHFFRGIGGGVEFGERAESALVREWREEFGLTLRRPELLGVFENFFTHEERPGHEIVFVYSATTGREIASLEKAAIFRTEIVKVAQNFHQLRGAGAGEMLLQRAPRWRLR